MVQTKQKRGIEVETPSSRSVSGGWRTSLILRHRLCWATFRATSQMRRRSFWVSSLILRRRLFQRRCSFWVTSLILRRRSFWASFWATSLILWRRAFWAMSRMDGSCHVRIESCYAWMSHVACERILTHVWPRSCRRNNTYTYSYC